MNVQDVGLCGVTAMNYKWYLSDLKKVNKNGYKVFSCFSCGGGSSMGYKLAGFEVVGNCEIDPKTNEVYKTNHNPRYSFNMDIREFLKLDKYPKELYELDILDGSPPCTSFSTAGVREKGWGKQKVFAEGNKLQRLDDLFFPFIELAGKLKPKVIIAENVTGIVKGNAKGYVTEIINEYKKHGYITQIFKLNSATMGVPQKRERIFFVSYRNDLKFQKLKLQFNEKPILFGEYRSNIGKPINKNTDTARLLNKRTKKDKKLADIKTRLGEKYARYNAQIVHDDMVCPTITSGGEFYRFADACKLSDLDIILSQTFPLDYNFKDKRVQFICGMSVPPIMMAKLAEQVYLQWLK